MKNARILAIDVESCSVKSKYPTYSDLIIGISVHNTSSLAVTSSYEHKLFIVEDLTYEAEEVIIQFLNFLAEHRGSILTAYNLIGFDHPLLLNRSREHYPLGFQLIDLLSKFSLYDTMIAYRAYSQRSKSCKLMEALLELREEGYDCFIAKNKTESSGKDSLSLWAKQRAGLSSDFSLYMIEDSYNHMRMAQILLKLGIKDGLWFVTLPSVNTQTGRKDAEEIS